MLIFMNLLEMYLKVKYCEMNKISNLYLAIGTNKPGKIPKSGQYICKNSPYFVGISKGIWL
jgi:hypothetical protein